MLKLTQSVKTAIANVHFGVSIFNLGAQQYCSSVSPSVLQQEVSCLLNPNKF